MELEQAAALMLKQFERRMRDNGETFHALKDGAPDWMTDVCRDAHGRNMPDDFVFEVIVEGLGLLVDHDGNSSDAVDAIEADIYNRDLLTWLSSSLHRAEYVNESVNDGFVSVRENFDLFNVLQAGQLNEKREIFGALVDALNDKLDDIEAA